MPSLLAPTAIVRRHPLMISQGAEMVLGRNALGARHADLVEVRGSRSSGRRSEAGECNRTRRAATRRAPPRLKLEKTPAAPQRVAAAARVGDRDMGKAIGSRSLQAHSRPNLRIARAAHEASSAYSFARAAASRRPRSEKLPLREDGGLAADFRATPLRLRPGARRGQGAISSGGLACQPTREAPMPPTP